jgi:hypothetical protein
VIAAICGTLQPREEYVSSVSRVGFNSASRGLSGRHSPRWYASDENPNFCRVSVKMDIMKAGPR